MCLRWGEGDVGLKLWNGRSILSSNTGWALGGCVRSKGRETWRNGLVFMGAVWIFVQRSVCERGEMV